MKNKNHIPYMITEVIGEFLILISAIIGGYIIEHPKDILYGIIIFFLLSLGVAYKYLAGKYERNEL